LKAWFANKVLLCTRTTPGPVATYHNEYFRRKTASAKGSPDLFEDVVAYRSGTITFKFARDRRGGYNNRFVLIGHNNSLHSQFFEVGIRILIILAARILKIKGAHDQITHDQDSF
jgi:hypothetical protein